MSLLVIHRAVKCVKLSFYDFFLVICLDLHVSPSKMQTHKIYDEDLKPLPSQHNMKKDKFDHSFLQQQKKQHDISTT